VVIDRHGREARGAWQHPFLIGALVCAALLLSVAVRPPDASACPAEAPCTSPTAQVLCPFTPAGSTGMGAATFDIPKDAVNVTFLIKDAVTGVVYNAAHPICSGTTMSVTSSRVAGANKDVLHVDYTLTSNGSSNPSESHPVNVIASWHRQTDLSVTKTLEGVGESIDSGREVTYRIVIHNEGPAPSNGLYLADIFETTPAVKVAVKKLEQVKGPAPKGPLSSSPGVFTGKWDELGAGNDIIILVTVVATAEEGAGGLLTNKFHADYLADHQRIDPDETNNAGEVKTQVRSVPESKITKASGSGAAGTAVAPAGTKAAHARAGAKIKRVEVAIFRKGGGKPLNGSLPVEPTQKKGKCEWLYNTKGKFGGREPGEGGVCDSPIWLEAKGTSRWKLKLEKKLPKGKYFVYSRATATDGSTQWSFTKAEKDRRTLKIP
jgi:hypothetical protein